MPVLLVTAISIFAAPPEYSRDLASWEHVEVPSEPDRSGRFWGEAAQNSKVHWHVFTKDNEVGAELCDDCSPIPSQAPKFNPKVGKFHYAMDFAAVSDGWLVGFNQGEFGAALYWFSRDGKRKYKISDHQVQRFVSLTDGVYAIEGLGHLTMSEGSIIRIGRSKMGGR
jgi:hypothetical protein